MIILGKRDFLSGLLLAVSGAAYTLYAWWNYPVGNLNAMGPGMFPLMAGVALLLLGSAALVQAIRNQETTFEFDLLPFVYVIGGLSLFAVLLRPFGFMPAIAAMTLALTWWHPGLRMRTKLLLAVALPIFAYLVFFWGLNVRMAPFRMPF